MMDHLNKTEEALRHSADLIAERRALMVQSIVLGVPVSSSAPLSLEDSDRLVDGSSRSVKISPVHRPF
jgi:hypothetical protein